MSSVAVKVPLRERINIRMIVFAAVVLLMVGFPMYIYLDAELTGGVEDVGNGYKRVDLKAISLFSFDQINGRIDDVPKPWRALDGQKVVMYGEIWAPDSASPDLTHFDLCYSIAKCCFSGPPQVQHFVKSKTVNGTVPYYNNLVKVTGTMHVKVVPGPEKVASVYQLDVERVEPAT